MANPILKSDIIAEDVQPSLDKLLETLGKIKTGLDGLQGATIQIAQAEQQKLQTTQSDSAAMAAQAQRIAELERLVAALNKAQREHTNTTRAVNEEKKKYKKLTDDEIRSVEELRAALAGTSQEQMNALKNINVQNKSYNELNATYNALKDSLNKLTTAERQNTEAGKAMTEQARNVRDTMNQLQQATGNYTLNVGNYMSAMNGLQFQTQQLLREIPSAQNVQQFFLAISNNIPMFADALMRYNRGLPEIKVKLTSISAEIAKQEALMVGMNAQSAEYAAKQEYINALKKQEVELQKLTMGGWKAVLKSVLSWQTLLIAGLLLLRKLPDIIKSIAEKWKEWRHGVTLVTNEMNTLTAKASVFSEVIKKTNDEVIKLDMIVERLKYIDKGTQEWKNAVAMVNDITKQNLDYVTTTKEEIEKVTEAYKEQAIQIATNDIIAEKIAKSRAQKALVKAAMDADTLEGAMELAGIKPDTKEGKKFIKAWNDYNATRPRDFTPNEDWLQLPEIQSDLQTSPSPVMLGHAEPGSTERNKVENMVRGKMQDMIDEEAEKILMQMIKEVAPLKKKRESNKTYSLKGVDFLENELLDKDAVIELESNFKRRLAMLVTQEEKEREVLKKKYDRESKDLEFNKEHNLITEKEYQEQKKKIDDNYNNLTKTNYEGNFEEMGVIQRKYWNKRNEITAKEAEREEKEALKRDKKAIKDLDNEYSKQLVAVKRRVRSVTDEKQKNADLAHNIHVLTEELAALNTMTIESSEDASGYTEKINKLNQEIEKLRKQMDFTKELSNYGSIWDILQRNGAFNASEGTMRGIAKNLLGDIADSLEPDQIEQIYDTFLSNAEKSLSTWYKDTMGYINDLISAYVDLANAKADAAKEATEAAQEEYDKEKALLEAGYASRVEATWAEYQEKKAAQEKAEADAKAAAQAQQELNSIESASSLITASANIWKTFSAIPVVGIPMAIAALGTMWGSFIAAKSKAYEVSKYGEGGFEVLEGGSHASGHDIDLGVRNRRGRRMRAEGKEGLGIFSRRAMEHYGANNIEAMVNSVNRLEFEGNAAKRMSLERSVGMQILSMPRTDLHRLESGMDKLISYGSRSRTVNADGSVTEYRNNGKVTIKKG